MPTSFTRPGLCPSRSLNAVAGLRLSSLPAIVVLVVGMAGVAHAQASDTDVTRTYSTGAVLDPPEVYQSFPKTPAFRDFLPVRADLSASFPAAGDQGMQGSCTAWAVGYAARSYYAATTEGRPSSNSSNIASPAYIFDRLHPPGTSCQSYGVPIGGALALLQEAGAASLASFPYSDGTCSPPTVAQEAAATDFRINSFESVDMKDPDRIKGEIAQGNPVIIDLSYAQGLFGLKASSVYDTGMGPPDVLHAVTLVGYDEARQAFKFINSWGPDWGDHGFGWLSYNFVASDVLEAFVIRMDKPVPRPAPVPTPTPGPDKKSNDADVMPSVECGELHRSSAGDSLEGFVGKPEELAAAQTYAAAQGLKSDVELRPWPQCEALMTLEAALASSDAPKVVGDHTRNLRAGDTFSFDINTPSHDSYLLAAYIEADGTVVNLIQSSLTSLIQYPAHSQIVLGDGADGRDKFTVTGPYGNEMLLVVASPSPLFPKALPKTETEREFLTDLRSAVLLHRPEDGKAQSTSAVYVAINTTP